MNQRDRDYIENRLMAPASPALDAAGRLRQVGRGDLAARLMDAVKTFNDECRAIRRLLDYTEAGTYSTDERVPGKHF